MSFSVEGIMMMAACSVPVAQGDVIAGRYVVERTLGAGAMGIVVAARNEQLEQLVAIKVVRDGAVESGAAVARFLREARAAAKLKSEHVTRVLDVGTLESGAPYIVMEYLEGSSLAQLLATSGPMDVDGTVRLLLQACEAVAEAHAAGIIHRDLKPQNLFLTHSVDGSPKLKVLDFGTSKAIGQANVGQGTDFVGASAMLGSAYYMAPEQMMSSRRVDARVDIWALGVVLFELLTGRRPFEADSMPGLCHKVIHDPPLPASDLRADIPYGLSAIIECCLMKEPAHRFASAEDLAAALTRFRVLPRRYARDMVHVPAAASASRSSRYGGGAQGESTPPYFNSRSRPPSARRRAPTAVWTLASVLAGATVLVGVGIRRSEHPPETRHARGLAIASAGQDTSSRGAPISPMSLAATPETVSGAAGALLPLAESPPAISSKPEASSVESRPYAVTMPVPVGTTPSDRPADASAPPATRPPTDVDRIPARR
jgi:serine/threonine-protein kinase